MGVREEFRARVQIDRAPIPAPNRKRMPHKYPWLDLAVGQRFLWERTPEDGRSQARNAGKTHGRTFVCRRDGQRWYVWRIG